MVGSPDFIGDLKVVKGKTDTGFVAPMAAGVVAAFETDQESIARYREMYRGRLELLISLLTGAGYASGVGTGGGVLHVVAGAEPGHLDAGWRAQSISIS